MTNNSYTVDGVNFNDPQVQSAVTDIPFDDLQEVQVSTSGQSAEFGSASGGVFNFITKSGSNQFRGLASVYGQNKSLASNNISSELAAQGIGPSVLDKDYEGGGNLGGPIVRDRLWFFGSYHRQEQERSQSDFPEHAELAWIFNTVTPVAWAERTPTYKEKRQQGVDNSLGLLDYPILQAADIVIYKASRVPVGKDQAAHLELSREIVRAFNRRYGPIFPEPEPVFTDAPTVLGIDGQAKMSKSAGNTIPIFAEPDEIRRLVMSMVTDPLRIKRTDPGRPEVCNVCGNLHRFFGGDFLQIQDGERTARTGCVETKQLLAERIIAFFEPMRARRAELAARPDLVEEVLAAGRAKVRPIIDATMAEVREAVGIGPSRGGRTRT